MSVVSLFKNPYVEVSITFELHAISACVLGGISASGRAGTLLVMILGAALIGIISFISKK